MLNDIVGRRFLNLTGALTKRWAARRRQADTSKTKVECDPRAESMLREAGLGPLLDRSADEVNLYSLDQVVRRKPAGRLIGIEVWTWGRFANAVFANINAISAADHLGLEYVVLCETEGFRADKILRYKGIKIYSSRSLLKADGWLLRGPFWEHIGGWPPIRLAEQRLLARSIIRRCLERPDPPADRVSDELAIHIRGGDIFGDDVNPLYVQPPLVFYRKVVRIASTRYHVQRVRIVAEDRLNPCVAALEDYLLSQGIAFVYQSSTLAEDFASLLDVQYFAFGIGTFGPAVCLISDTIKGIFYYLADPSLAPDRYPWIDGHHPLYDAEGAYIKQGEWRNDESQRRQMLEYSDDAHRRETSRRKRLGMGLRGPCIRWRWTRRHVDRNLCPKYRHDCSRHGAAGAFRSVVTWPACGRGAVRRAN